jgi:thioredoxin-related protein
MDWLNVWDDYDKRQILSSNYRKINIRSFPTYVIVDRTGEIVYKEGGKIEKAIDFFINLISE